jgi:hypothetical protein
MSNALRCALAGGLAVLAVGCGSGVYEQRFQNTQLLFSRLALRNQHLMDAAWTDKGGLLLRLPHGLEEIPAPAPPPATEDGEVPVPEHDARQPHMLSVILPGMRGAFRQEGNRYLYVLSSRDIRTPEGDASVIEQPGTDPTKFNADICRLLADTTGLGIDYTKFVATTYPKARVPFVLSKSFKVASAEFTQSLDDGRTLDWRLTMHFFEGSEAPIQGGILLIEPKAGANTQFDTSLELALETFELNEPNFKSATGEAAPNAPGL